LHRLGHHRRILAVVAQLLGAASFCHPTKVIRLSAPTGQQLATRPHQDFVVLQLTPDVITAWVPLTPCDAGHQGLWIAPGANRTALPTDPSVGGRRPLYVRVAPHQRWATAPFALGDVVLLHSLTVHCGGPNRSDRLRVSYDGRYQRTVDPISAEWLQPHLWPTTPSWDVLCGGWSTRRWVAASSRTPVAPARTPAQIDAATLGLTVPPSTIGREGGRTRS
jgi:hypothetical protein